MASTEDYYTILGVDKKSTKQEIQKAFRRLAKKYHPDKNKDTNAQEEFIKIVKAYETLSDENKCKEYDDRSSLPGGHQTWSTQGFNMNEFDINEFFRQYEDQFMRHAPQHDHHHNDAHHQHHHQYHQQQHQYHHKASFGGIELDDLFHNLDDEEWQFLGNPFASHSGHYNIHHHAAEEWNTITPGFGDGNSFFGNLDELSSARHRHSSHINIHTAGYSCRTVTRQVNGVSMTQTQCS